MSEFIPGLRKAGKVAFLRERSLRLWQCSDYSIREMFEHSDVMSEGAARTEGAEQRYYGTTSIVLPLESCGGFIPDAEHEMAARVLSVDPHARVRAIRIACREAQVRSVAPLGQIRAELCFSRTGDGVKIDIDVEATQEVQNERVVNHR